MQRPTGRRGSPNRVRTGGNGNGGGPRASAPTPPRAPELVLLVEDNDDNRAMYGRYLEWDGFRIVEASDGLQALDRAVALVPSIIVMDLTIPRLDGWDATRRLKADSRTRHIPVLALTAHAFSGAAEQARAAGCDGYLAKPCLPQELARVIRSLIQADGEPRKRPRARSERAGSSRSSRREGADGR